MIKIGEMFNIVKGTVQSSKCVEGEYDFITASEEWKTHNEYSHDCEALIFAMGASGSLGRTHYANGKFISSDLCFILTPKKEYREKLNLRFYYYYFNTFREKIVSATATGTSKLAINRKKFFDYKIHYIDINRQIVLINTIEEMQLLLEELLSEVSEQEKYMFSLRQSILQQAVEGKLCDQDPNDEPASVLLEKIKAEKEKLIAEKKVKKQKELLPITDKKKPFELPRGWEWCRLIDIGELNRGKSRHRPRNDIILYENGIFPLVQTGDVARCKEYITTYTALYNELGLSQSRIWQKGTLCITIAANIADTGILNFDACFPDSVVGFNPYLVNMDVRYFKWYIDISKNNIEKYAPATAQKNINLEILNNLPIPLPPLAEQQRIVEKVDKLMTLCDELEQEIINAKKYASQLMEAVLQEAFSSAKGKNYNNVIGFVPKQQEEEVLLAAARGGMKEDTWSRLRARAIELADEES